MIVELLHTADCPNVDKARSVLRSCLAELGLDQAIQEREGDYPSPTVLVNGVDVMGEPHAEGAACRLVLPSRERILDALSTT